MMVAGPNESGVLFKEAYKNRLKKEWSELSNKNPALYSIVSHLAGYSSLTLQKDLIVTQILRTDEEQKAIYGPNTTKKSSHQFYCAVDLRCKQPYHTEEERDFLASALRSYDFLNKFKHLPSGSKTVWIHTVDNGAIHFHLQFWGTNRQLPSYIQLLPENRSNVA